MEISPRKSVKDRSVEVLDSARELFFENGYRGTTIQQIADRAGYSKRTVYLDYRNKDELFMFVCAEGAELMLSKLERLPADELPVEEGVERVLDVLLDFSREHREYFRMIFSESTPDIVANCSEPLKQRLAALERACLMVVVKLAERAVDEGRVVRADPWEAAGIFVGTATGIILLSTGGLQTVFSQEGLESLVKKAIWTFWRGLQIHPPAATSWYREE